jgi:XisI protein
VSNKPEAQGHSTIDTPSYGRIDTQAIIDLAGDHYMIMHVGWHRGQRMHGGVLHIDIIDGRIWMQHDGTKTSCGISIRCIDGGCRLKYRPRIVDITCVAV